MEDNFPYDSQTQNEIKTFFKNKLKSKKKYTYSISNEGNLETYDSKTGELINSILLKYYRPLTKEEIDDMERERIESIIQVEEQIDIQKAMLRKAYQDYKETKVATDVVRINQEIANLDAQKVLLRSPVREIIDLQSIEKRSIYFDMPQEKRKEELVYKMFTRDFPLWKLYGRYTDSKESYETIEKKRVSLVPGEVVLANGKIARIFGPVEDEYNGFMSIYNINDFVYQDTRFSSPYQAFEAYRLTEAGAEDLRNKILQSRSIKFIQITSKKNMTLLKNTKNVWKDILRVYYEQNPDLVKKLIETNEDVLVFADISSYVGGVGFLSGQEELLDAKKWKTPNLVGEALMELRSEFKEGFEVKEGGSFKESAKTEEEINKQRKSSIINVIRKRSH
uniref:NADAR domain-containing protein n=1 Tax=viral metagenome TaxID=1070528 RepID=A0A6C0D730_9ZZZZ